MVETCLCFFVYVLFWMTYVQKGINFIPWVCYSLLMQALLVSKMHLLILSHRFAKTLLVYNKHMLYMKRRTEYISPRTVIL